jgi:hypothetical protein
MVWHFTRKCDFRLILIGYENCACMVQPPSYAVRPVNSRHVFRRYTCGGGCFSFEIAAPNPDLPLPESQALRKQFARASDKPKRRIVEILVERVQADTVERFGVQQSEITIIYRFSQF